MSLIVTDPFRRRRRRVRPALIIGQSVSQGELVPGAFQVVSLDDEEKSILVADVPDSAAIRYTVELLKQGLGDVPGILRLEKPVRIDDPNAIELLSRSMITLDFPLSLPFKLNSPANITEAVSVFDKMRIFSALVSFAAEYASMAVNEERAYHGNLLQSVWIDGSGDVYLNPYNRKERTPVEGEEVEFDPDRDQLLAFAAVMFAEENEFLSASDARNSLRTSFDDAASIILDELALERIPDYETLFTRLSENGM